MKRMRVPSLTALAALLCAAATAASAQVFDAAAAARVSPAPSGAAAAVTRVSVAGMPSALTTTPAALAPAFAAPASAPSALSAAPAASVAVPASAAAAQAAPALSAAPKRAAADGPTPLQEPLRPGERWHGGDPRMGEGDVLVHDGPRGRELVPLSSFEEPIEPVDWRSSRAKLDRTFDGSRASGRDDDGVPGAPHDGVAPALAKPSAPALKTSAAVPAPARRSFASSLGWKLALGALLFLLTPGIALAQTAGAPITITISSTLSLLAAVRPAASAIGALAGAIYGMSAARSKDGSEVSAAETFSSVLRYGALGGAAVYMLFDVTNMAFAGSTGAGIQPLSSAIVTAALGRTAFQGKFMDAATTSADRIVGAFPAVAAALGISLGVAAGFVAIPAWTTMALGAMTVTGVAVAIYTAVFKLGRSPADGPALMGKGYVLQSLMTGLSLATSGPYLPVIFGLMGAAGFGLVLWATGRELWSLIPKKTPPPPPPGTPAERMTPQSFMVDP